MSWRRPLQTGLIAVTLGVGLFLAGGIGLLGVIDDGAGTGTGASTERSADQDRLAAIRKLEAQVERVPRDYVSLASLGLAYVEEARVTVNPAFYKKADRVLARSLRLNTEDNYVGAAGMAAVAAARHDFALARVWAERGLAINPSNAVLYGTLADALTQLGDYEGGRRATQRMLDLSPDSASLARASYSWELQGDTARARELMQRARKAAGNPAAVAFTERALGDIALGDGQPAAALEHYQAGLDALPADVFCLEGRARAFAALGRVDDAVRDFDEVVRRSPEPSFVRFYGEYLESLGRLDEAREQYEFFEAQLEIFRANGENPDIDQTLYYADHGEPARALEEGERGIAGRTFLEMQDAYAWALHVNGRHAEAKVFSERALAVGARNALLHFHAGMIDEALGDLAGARTHLQAALDINPHFSPRFAPVAREALTRLP